MRCDIRKVSFLAAILFASVLCNGAAPNLKTEKDIVYCTVDGHELKLNAFLPADAEKPVPAMVDIHGGWWTMGQKGEAPERIAGGMTIVRKDAALFSIDYRLGKDGGFPQNIRDCRNAIRFIRKNAARFNIDPERIGCFGGSAGSHLSTMVAMVPEDFDDGGPTEELKSVSAKVCCAFAFVGPTDFLRQWDEAEEGTPHNARSYHRVLFHGVEPDTEEHKALYLRMSPAGHVRKDVPPLLLCDGELDDVVPHLHGKGLHEKLQAVGADSTYWMTPQGRHAYPSGAGFQKVLEDFLMRTLKLEKKD